MGLPAELPLFEEGRKVLSVGELTKRLKDLIERTFRYVWVAGEISNFRQQPSGHFYFTLKDEEAQLSCAMWRSFTERLAFRPEDGMEALAYGRLEVYAPHGKYQLIVEQMEPRGAGALAIRFEQLKRKLEAEGLFDPARKRPLPLLPRSIVIVTSPVGAALQDMLRTITSRCPAVSLLIYPVKVQGDGAAEEIADAIRRINLARPETDVLIVGRGGGSIEDLWAFNEEVVARAIYSSHIPVVSAVGHETDFTIADFVADVRALTPTDAGLKVVPKLADLEAQIEEWRAKLRRALESRAELARAQLNGYATSYALGEPRALVARQFERLDEMHERLRVALEGALKIARERLGALWKAAGAELNHAGRAARERLEGIDRHLRAVSPLAVLSRGYSITQTPEGHVLRSADETESGAEIVTTLARGRLRSRVESRESGA